MKKMSIFEYLNEDLLDIVCSFAFDSSYCDVFYSLKYYLLINWFNVPRSLIRGRIFSLKYLRMLQNPLVVFEPISAFISYRELFEWDTVYHQLWELDFRKKIVKSLGSRGRWHLRFALDWKTIMDYSMFRRILMNSRNILKPTLKLEIMPSQCS